MSRNNSLSNNRLENRQVSFESACGTGGTSATTDIEESVTVFIDEETLTVEELKEILGDDDSG